LGDTPVLLPACLYFGLVASNDGLTFFLPRIAPELSYASTRPAR
jgi:hypothetical protein